MRYRRLLTIGLLLLTSGFIIWPILSPRTLISDHLNDAQVRFSTGINHLIGLNECIDLSWSVDHIREVYLDGKGVVGEGTQNWCANDDLHIAPTLKVNFVNEKTREYVLPSLGWLITADSNFHFRLLYGLLLFVAIGYWGEIPWLSPQIQIFFGARRTQITLLTLWMISIVVIFWINSPVWTDVLVTLNSIQHFLQTFFFAVYLT